jgi:hypothetical protein
MSRINNRKKKGGVIRGHFDYTRVPHPTDPRIQISQRKRATFRRKQIEKKKQEEEEEANKYNQSLQDIYVKAINKLPLNPSEWHNNKIHERYHTLLPHQKYYTQNLQKFKLQIIHDRGIRTELIDGILQEIQELPKGEQKNEVRFQKAPHVKYISRTSSSPQNVSPYNANRDNAAHDTHGTNIAHRAQLDTIYFLLPSYKKNAINRECKYNKDERWPILQKIYEKRMKRNPQHMNISRPTHQYREQPSGKNVSYKKPYKHTMEAHINKFMPEYLRTHTHIDTNTHTRTHTYARTPTRTDTHAQYSRTQMPQSTRQSTQQSKRQSKRQSTRQSTRQRIPAQQSNKAAEKPLEYWLKSNWFMLGQKLQNIFSFKGGKKNIPKKTLERKKNIPMKTLERKKNIPKKTLERKKNIPKKTLEKKRIPMKKI